MAALTAAGQVTFPYSSDFGAGEDFSTQIIGAGSEASYNLDMANSVFNYTKPEGGTTGTKLSTAGFHLSGLASQDFVISSRVTVNDIHYWQSGQAGTTVAVRFGFIAFSETDQFTSGAGPLYQVLWHAGGGEGAAAGRGDLRIQALGSGVTGFAEDVTNIGVAGIGNTYDLVFTGEYNNGTLDLAFSVFDVTGGNLLLGTTTATHTEPLAGEYFAFRHSTGHPTQFIDIDHHDFAIVPEPATAGLVAGLAVLGLLAVARWRKRS